MKHLNYMTQFTRQQMDGVSTPQRATGGSSTKSKVFKSPEHKRKTRERNKANGRLRAELHSQKSFEQTVDKRAAIQKKIDAIGAGGAVNG